MMLRIWKSLAVLAVLLSFSSVAKEFVEGKHYYQVTGEVSASPTITEYFSFYCPACYRQEPFMKHITSFLPESQQISKVHVTGMPGRDIASEERLTQALAAAKLLKVEQAYVKEVFNQIHVKRQNTFTRADVESLFAKAGIDSKQFNKAFNSFAAKGEAKQMAKAVQKIREQGYSAVPTLVINNIYTPNIKSITSMQEYEALVKYLLAKTG